jgi:hypothetical protein
MSWLVRSSAYHFPVATAASPRARRGSSTRRVRISSAALDLGEEHVRPSVCTGRFAGQLFVAQQAQVAGITLRHEVAGDDDQELRDEVLHGDPGGREGNAQCRRGRNRAPVNCPVRQFRV